MSHESVVAHLKDAGYVVVLMPHELSDRNLQRLDACDLLIEMNKEHPFLKKMITRKSESSIT